MTRISAACVKHCFYNWMKSTHSWEVTCLHRNDWLEGISKKIGSWLQYLHAVCWLALCILDNTIVIAHKFNFQFQTLIVRVTHCLPFNWLVFVFMFYIPTTFSSLSFWYLLFCADCHSCINCFSLSPVQFEVVHNMLLKQSACNGL